jgi:lysophospholipase L1-like esterase
MAQKDQNGALIRLSNASRVRLRSVFSLRRWWPVAALALSACGRPGDGGRVTLYPVTVNLFYDENGNGVLDAQELVRLPDVTVAAPGSTSARTDTRGRAVLALPAGSYTLTVGAAQLPPYYVPPAPRVVTVAAATSVDLPVTLPIGNNLPNTYMMIGDSLTSDLGYPEQLADQLKARFGAGMTVPPGVAASEGRAGSKTGEGDDNGRDRIGDALADDRPAFTLILYGTNDWSQSACHNRVDKVCFTMDSLSSMVDNAKGAGSNVFLATLPPVNVGFDNLAPPARQDWVHAIDVQIRDLAVEKQVVLVDLEPVFLAQPNLAGLFNDHIHPNAEGVSLMVSTFFAAMTARPALAGHDPAPEPLP